MKPIVTVDHVSKRFSRNPQANRSYGASDLLRELFGRARPEKLRKNEFWAVDDVSFQMEPGDSVALVGRNGSGKTTMLMMMNGLLKPDKGTIIIDGRVQALINLGAGFNEHLSGRENIFNAASLMGMSSREIHNIVDGIVDFSELEEFIDSPFGTYSSGMKARLGFSVAISLKPDILLIDEILAVGDYSFQNKCFVKLHELKQSGVGIVLVSHSHTHVVQLCERAIWLERGQPVQAGSSDDVVKAYLDFMNKEAEDRIVRLNELQKETSKALEQRAKRAAMESLYDALYTEFDRIERLEFTIRVDGKETHSIRIHDTVEIEYSFELLKQVSDLNVSLCFYTKDGLKISTLSTLNGNLLKNVREGRVHCRITIPDFNLNPGEYVLVMPIHEGKSFLWRGVIYEFVVTAPDKLTWELVDLRCEYSIESPEEVRRTVMM